MPKMTQGEQIQLISSSIIIGFLVIGLITRNKYGSTPLLRYSMYWVAIFGVSLMLYAYKDFFTTPLERVKSVIFPSMPIDQNGIIKIRKSSDNHFYIDVKINEHNIKFLIDTGATEVLLSKSAAKAAGIDVSTLEFNVQSYTASGTTMIARTKVDIEIAGFRASNFPVYVNSSENDSSLLGMSLLNLMDSVSLEGDELILKY